MYLTWVKKESGMDVAMKAFYGKPIQARKAIRFLQDKGLHINRVNYYKRKWGNVENFNARGNVSRKILKSFFYGVLSGFVLGTVVGFSLLRFEVINTFQDMGVFGTTLAIGVIGAFFVPAIATLLAAISSEDTVDIDEADFDGDQVVVDFHVELKESEQAEDLLKIAGAHKVLKE